MAVMVLLSLTESELRRRTSLKWHTYPEDVLPLWVAEMDVSLHPAVGDALRAAIDLGDTGYPFGNAYGEAFVAMATTRWGWTPDITTQVRRSGDVMNAMLAVVLSTTAEGDNIVLNPPVYPPFWQVISGYGRKIVASHLTTAGRLDLADLERVFEESRPTAYLLCSPHNPTGAVHTLEELTEVVALCRRFDVQLIADEIHAALVDPGTTFVPLLAVPGAERAVVATSAGKAWNLAAFKAGQLIAGAEIATELWGKIGPLAFQSTGHFGAIAHTAALVHAQDWVDDLMIEVAANKQLLARLLAEQVPEARYTPAPGTYLAWVDLTETGLSDPGRWLLRHGKVAFNPGDVFGADYGTFVRINLATSPELIAQAVGRVADALRARG